MKAINDKKRQQRSNKQNSKTSSPVVSQEIPEIIEPQIIEPNPIPEDLDVLPELGEVEEEPVEIEVDRPLELVIDNSH